MRSSPEGLRHKRVKDIVSQDNLVRPVKMKGAQLWTQTQASKAVFSSINLIDENRVSRSVLDSHKELAAHCLKLLNGYIAYLKKAKNRDSE